MATTTFTCNKDARIARRFSDSWDAGAGASDYLPVGPYGGYLYRSLLGFSYSFSGMVSITSAILHIKTSSQYYVAFGSDPDVYVRRVTSSWSEGTYSSLSSSNSVIYPGPSTTATNEVLKDVSTAENTWITVDITAMMEAARAAGVFYGLRLHSAQEGEGDTDETTEFYAREYGSNDAYIEVTYTTNTVPAAPTNQVPAAGAVVVPDPTISFTHSDADSDPLLDYDIQVSTDSTFASVTHLNLAAQTGGISGNNVSRVYSAWGGTALTRGTTYYWRVRTSSSTGELGEGAWSAARSFIVNSLPTTTVTEPSASGRLGKLAYTAGAGWASPRLVVAWSMSDADAGQAQSAYQVFIKKDSDGTTFYDSGKVSSAATTLTVPATFVEGDKYRVKVQVWDALDETGDYSTEWTVRVRWGVGLYRYDMSAAPVSLALNSLATTTGSNSSVVMEYSSNSTTSTPGTFYATVGAVPLQQYFFYKAWLLAWGASPATSPSLDALVLDYSATILTPDSWVRSDTTSGVILTDPGSYVYGSHSLRIAANGAKYAYQTITVLPNTNYVLSGRIKAQGNAQARLALWDVSDNVLVNGTLVTATQDFPAVPEALYWYSGSNTQVKVVCHAAGSSGTYAWFDTLKLEASTVVTPWSPGQVGRAGMAVDAGGLQIDASAGAILRLRGSSGGIDDLVQLGAHGLTIGSAGAAINAAIRASKRRLFR
jgi:hypothetical protein